MEINIYQVTYCKIYGGHKIIHVFMDILNNT